MTITCPKCAYARLPSDDAPDWQCPSCGIAYAKFKVQNTELKSRVSSETVEQKRQISSSTPMILCHKFIISKSRLLQTSETDGVVLITEDAIYFAKKGGMGLLVSAGGILGGAIGCVIAGVASAAVEHLITEPRLKAAGAIQFEQLPPEIQAFFERLKCSGDVVVLPRSAIKQARASFWTGINLKTETHLFELRPSLLDFSQVCKRLSLYKWI